MKQWKNDILQSYMMVGKSKTESLITMYHNEQLSFKELEKELNLTTDETNLLLYLYDIKNSECFKTIKNCISEDIQNQLIKEFLIIKKDYDLNDNYRFAIVGNKDQEDEYCKIQKCGCCGFYDEEIEIAGIKFKVGFNYGH